MPVQRVTAPHLGAASPSFKSGGREVVASPPGAEGRCFACRGRGSLLRLPGQRVVASPAGAVGRCFVCRGKGSPAAEGKWSIALRRDVEHGIGAAKGSLGRVPETLLRPHLAPTRGAFPAGSRHSGSRRARGRSRQRSHPAARWLADQHSTHSLLCPRRFEPGARGPSATASPAVSRSQRGRGLAHAPGPRRPVRASPS